MDQENEAAGNGHLGVDRHGDRELTISRMFRAPREAMYAAWRDPALFRRWWVPQSAHGIHLIPSCIDHNPCAHLRRPMVMMCHG